MPRRNRGKNIEPINHEIERTAHQIRKATKAQKKFKMGDEAPKKERIPMKSFTNPNMDTIRRGVQPPPVAANNFEIRHGTILMLQQNQFGGAPTEDPHAHLRSFEKNM